MRTGVNEPFPSSTSFTPQPATQPPVAGTGIPQSLAISLAATSNYFQLPIWQSQSSHPKPMKSTPMKTKQLLMRLAAAVALLIPAAIVQAATYTAVNTGDFSDPATFSPAGTPGPGDTVVVSNGVTLTISDTRTISALTVGRSGGSGSVLTISPSGSLTVSGQYGFAGTAPVIHNNGTFNCGGGAAFSTGAFNNNGTATFSGGSQAFNGNITVTQGAHATLNLAGGGSVPFGGSSTLLAGASGNTVNYAAGGQNIFGTTYQNLTVSGNSPSASGGGGTTVKTINGTLTINLNAGQQINSAGNLTFGNGASIIRTRGALNGTPTFSGTVNVTYNGAAAMTTGSELPASASALNNLTIAATASVTLNAHATVNGAFSATYNGSTVPLIAGTRTLAFVNSPVNITVTGSALATGSSHTIVSSSGATVSGPLGVVAVTGAGAPYASGPTASTSTGQLVLTIPDCAAITAAPDINAPLYAGAASVSGTSASGAAIVVYDLTSSTQIGATTASGTSWTATVTPLTAGHSIAATAQVGDECASPFSSPVTVQGAPPGYVLSLLPVADTNINAGTYLVIPSIVLTNGVPAN